MFCESYLLNALTRRLHPGKALEVGLQVDAHHVIEQRAFAKFKKDWALLGWESELDMHEWHIPSPKNLPGMDGTVLENLDIPVEDVFSLTKEMEAAIKLDNQVISKRFVKKQQMKWTKRGTHLFLQIRIKVLNEAWREKVADWYPATANGVESQSLAA